MQIVKCDLSEVLLLAVDAGEDVMESVDKMIADHNIKHATILSAFGTFDFVRLHWILHTEFPPEEHYEDISGPFETLSLGGNIINGKPHFHVTISDVKGAYGGHLHVGRTLYMFEMTIGILEGPEMDREILPKLNIPRLRLK